jgi:hypothetical protein
MHPPPSIVFIIRSFQIAYFCCWAFENFVAEGFQSFACFVSISYFVWLSSEQAHTDGTFASGTKVAEKLLFHVHTASISLPVSLYC